MNTAAIKYAAKQFTQYSDQIVTKNTANQSAYPYQTLAQQIDQSVARINELLKVSISRSLRNDLRETAAIFGIELNTLDILVDIKMVGNFESNPSATIGPREVEISINFEASPALPRRHKITLLRAAIKHSPILKSLNSDLNTQVCYILDKCKVATDSVIGG